MGARRLSTLRLMRIHSIEALISSEVGVRKTDQAIASKYLFPVNPLARVKRRRSSQILIWPDRVVGMQTALPNSRVFTS